MATDLESYERAYRRRSTADDELLKQIFGAEELEGLRISKPGLIETARAYFPHLTSSTYDRLVREPATLQLEKDRCSREMEQLAVQNYSAFISNAKVTQNVQQGLASIQKHLDGMAETILPLQETIRSCQATASDLSSRRGALRNVLQQERLLLELLELPQLLDACIRNHMYDESLELLAYCSSMFQAHELRGEEIKVVTNLQEQVSAQRANLHNSLVGQLKTDIHLPACVRIIGFLRRLQEHSEDDLRRVFIEYRGKFLESHKQQVESQRSHRGSVVTALRNATDLLRTHVFDIGMQYKALFGQEDATLSTWLNDQVNWLTGLLRAHILPDAEARIDAPALATILRQCLHTSSTLKRLGGQFFPAVANIFEVRMDHIVCEMLDVALLTFHSELGRYDWVPSTALAGSSSAAATSMAGGGEGGLTSEATTAASSGLSWLHPQAMELTRHRPLAVLCNDMVQMFNELRQCALSGLRARVVAHCSEALMAAINLLRNMKQSQLFQPGTSKANELAKLCEHFARILVPLISAHLEAMYGASAKLDVEAVAQAMMPDLLSPPAPPEPEVPATEAAVPAAAEAPAGAATSLTAAAAEVGDAPAAADAVAEQPPSAGADSALAGEASASDAVPDPPAAEAT
mmetsp:Transcript_36168/g.84781  ORF Transcript_36168/g.84781 Transcript_36168/m.84781 type:complete len:635 (+) Transcript_36168:91-1995(+)